jgi:hypothetical protein
MPQDTMSRPRIRLHDPVADEGTRQETLAQRGGDLSGKVVALLDNTKPLVDTLLDEVKTLIERDFPGARFRYFKKPSVSGAQPELIEQLAACDVVVTAVGD